ncbi:hypothetical protein [Sphingomonas sp. dw_22]|uniref:hypothetical protein n=1 Tax=Sphingomonas sp. dw_22 TaxID=2721175 RepID=UPI002116591C|nr:hypothetical protein [Sphingomonas sp. dw_22]
MFLTALALTMAAPCRIYDTALPRPLAGWMRLGRTLDTGRAVTLAAGRDKAAATNVRIRKAGVFGIAVDQDGWVDLYQGRGKALKMASESRGPACSTIRKVIRYRLKPGTYRVEVRQLQAPRVKLMLVAGER